MKSSHDIGSGKAFIELEEIYALHERQLRLKIALPKRLGKIPPKIRETREANNLDRWNGQRLNGRYFHSSVLFLFLNIRLSVLSVAFFVRLGKCV